MCCLKTNHCDRCKSIESEWGDYISPGALHDKMRTSSEMTEIAQEAADLIAQGNQKHAVDLLRSVGLHEAKSVSLKCSE